MAAPAGGGEPHPQANLLPPGRSFAAVTKGRPDQLPSTVQLAPRQYGMKDGKPSVTFTQSELQPGIQRLQHSLIAKFSAGRPQIEEVRRLFSQAWGMDTPVTIGAMDARHVLIILPTALLSNRILAHPTRKIGNYLFRLFRWSQDFNRNKEPSTTTSWIKLPGLPAELFNAGYIEAIVRPIGRFLAIDEGTRTCRNPSFARACIELDLHTPKPGDIWIDLGSSGGFWQPITFENNLFYCRHCKLHGHQLENCRKNRGAPVSLDDQRTATLTQTKDPDLSELQENKQGQQLKPCRKVTEFPTWEARDHGLPAAKPTGACSGSPLLQPQPPSSDTLAQSSRPALLSLTDQPSRNPDSENQGWTIVRKRNQKHKAIIQHVKDPATHTSFGQQGTTDPALQGTPNEPQESFHAPSPRMEVLSLSDKGSAGELPPSPSNVKPSENPPTHAETSSVVSTYNDLPSLTILRRTKDKHIENNKISASTVSKQPFGLSSNQPLPIFSPRSTSRRSPAPAFLLPLLNNLLIRDVQPPSV